MNSAAYLTFNYDWDALSREQFHVSDCGVPGPVTQDGSLTLEIRGKRNTAPAETPIFSDFIMPIYFILPGDRPAGRLPLNRGCITNAKMFRMACPQTGQHRIQQAGPPAAYLKPPTHKYVRLQVLFALPAVPRLQCHDTGECSNRTGDTVTTPARRWAPYSQKGSLRAYAILGLRKPDSQRQVCDPPRRLPRLHRAAGVLRPPA